MNNLKKKNLLRHILDVLFLIASTAVKAPLSFGVLVLFSTTFSQVQRKDGVKFCWSKTFSSQFFCKFRLSYFFFKIKTGPLYLYRIIQEYKEKTRQKKEYMYAGWNPR